MTFLQKNTTIPPFRAFENVIAELFFNFREVQVKKSKNYKQKGVEIYFHFVYNTHASTQRQRVLKNESKISGGCKNVKTIK